MSDKRLIQQMIGKRVAWHPSLVLSAVVFPQDPHLDGIVVLRIPRTLSSPSSGRMMYIIIKCTRAIDSCGWEIRGQRRETVARAWKY